MSPSRAPMEFILLDSAIVPLDRIMSVIDDGHSGHCLYADLGDEARLISPWLLESSSPAETLVRDMRDSKRHTHGVARLAAPTSIDVVVLHLHQLRTLLADRKRYYLRYADGRALSDLWGVLDSTQRQALLGPIDTWEACATDEPCRYLVSYESRSRAEAVSMSLRLSSHQFGELLQAQRDTQRWSTWLATQPQLCDGYSLKDLRDLSRLTGKWLRTQGALPERVVQAVGVAVLRSKGEVLGHPELAGKLRQGAVGDDLEDWLAGRSRMSGTGTKDKIGHA